MTVLPRFLKFLLLLITVSISRHCPIEAKSPHAVTQINPIPARVGTQRSSSNYLSKYSSATVNGIKNSIASALAAGCSKSLLAPFDTIKTIQQQARNGGKTLSLIEATRLISSRPRGFLELYAGLGVSVFGAMPSVGLYFGVYSYCKDRLTPVLQNRLGCNENVPISVSGARTLAVAVSAAIGNTVASFSRVPYEVVKQKLQTGEYTSTLVALRHMTTTGGIRAFFPMGGVAIQMYRDIPYAIITLLTYECLKEHWVSRREKAHWRDMVAGGLSGGIGSFATNPMDVVKTRLQVDSHLYQGNVWICAAKTFEEGGPSSFLRGSVPRLMHKIPANAFFFVFYEGFRRIMRVDEVVAEK